MTYQPRETTVGVTRFTICVHVHTHTNDSSQGVSSYTKYTDKKRHEGFIFDINTQSRNSVKIHIPYNS